MLGGLTQTLREFTSLSRSLQTIGIGEKVQTPRKFEDSGPESGPFGFPGAVGAPRERVVRRFAGEEEVQMRVEKR